MTKLWKAFRSVLPYPAFRVVFSPCLLRDCTRHSPDLQPSVYLPCLRSSVPSVILFSAHPRDHGHPSRHRFSIFFPSHAALFSSGFTLPGNAFQRIQSNFPIVNIRFSALGNTSSLPTQSLGIDCTSRLAVRSAGTITLASQAVVSSWQVRRNNRVILPLALP